MIVGVAGDSISAGSPLWDPDPSVRATIARPDERSQWQWWAARLDPRLDFRKTDSLLVKKYASCFFGTDLVSRLLVRQVDTLIITGCTTSGCVRASAVDACQIGFRPMVVREAVGDRSQAAHDQSLFDLNAKYADVVSLAETLQYLNALRAAAAPGRAGD